LQIFNKNNNKYEKVFFFGWSLKNWNKVERICVRRAIKKAEKKDEKWDYWKLKIPSDNFVEEEENIKEKTKRVRK